MTSIDEIASSSGASEGSHGHSTHAAAPTCADEVHVPHLPLTGFQKVVCVVELIASAVFAVFLWSTLINHVMYLATIL